MGANSATSPEFRIYAVAHRGLAAYWAICAAGYFMLAVLQGTGVISGGDLGSGFMLAGWLLFGVIVTLGALIQIRPMVRISRGVVAISKPLWGVNYVAVDRCLCVVLPERYKSRGPGPQVVTADGERLTIRAWGLWSRQSLALQAAEIARHMAIPLITERGIVAPTETHLSAFHTPRRQASDVFRAVLTVVTPVIFAIYGLASLAPAAGPIGLLRGFLPLAFAVVLLPASGAIMGGPVRYLSDEPDVPTVDVSVDR